MSRRAHPTGRPALTGRRLAISAIALFVALVVVAFAASLVGLIDLSWPVWQGRLVRIGAAAVVGAGLSLGGAALQGQLRNPLAEPYILGIASGAGVGVLLGMALSAQMTLPGWVTTPTLAFLGAVGSTLVVYGVAQRGGRVDGLSLILSGVIVNAVNAAILLVIYLYVDPYRLADFARWSMGRLTDATPLAYLAVSAVCVVLGWVVLLLRSAALNALALGADVAASVGVSVDRLRIEVFAIVGLMTAAAVALSGPIGFLGLIVPHICRMLFGPDHRILLVTSGFLGAIFLVAVDTLCRSAGLFLNIAEIPVGIITAAAGGPFFLFLLRRRGTRT